MMENYPLLLDHYWDIASNKILSSTLIFMFEKNSGDSFPSLPSMFTNTCVILSRYVPVEQKGYKFKDFQEILVQRTIHRHWDHVQDH